jgi:hypothetical protein
LTSGDVFRVEVGGKLQITRMGNLWGEGYYSIEGYPLRDGMRAAWFRSASNGGAPG